MAAPHQASDFDSQTPVPGDSTELEFYSAHAWCLDPVLRLADLFERLSETLDQLEGHPTSWQREECKANLHLHVGAITCTIDDYLGDPAPSLRRLAEAVPALRTPLRLAQAAIDSAHYVVTWPARARVARWRQRWTASADAIADVVAANEAPDPDLWRPRRLAVERLLREPLPGPLLARRMRLPSGYRSQDFTHHDAAALADLFAAEHPGREEPVLVVGPRTIGAYFAPAVAARLRSLGWTSVTWCTVRPKRVSALWERRGLRRLASPAAFTLVPDESPNSGASFRSVVASLRGLGVPPQRIALLPALHPTQPDWHPPQGDEVWRGVTILRLEPSRLHKQRLLEPATIEPLLRSYFRAAGWEEVEVARTPETEVLDARLAAHFRDGFQCRLKRVFEVRLRRPGDSAPVVRRVLAKSVGWGWLGYHAYLAGRRLAGFVPETYGLRDGLLFTEWLAASEAGESGRPPLDLLACYVATRVRALPLAEDPMYAIALRYGWSGWGVLVDVLRGALGSPFGRLKRAAVHRHLRPFVAPAPALVDGEMSAADWVRSAAGFRKVDFEHHNFGWNELCVVDAAYDLAVAALEFGLAPREEQELVARYVAAGGDAAVADRLLLYKLLRGTVDTWFARAILARQTEPDAFEQATRLLWRARNALVHGTNRFSASLLPAFAAPAWTRRVVFMDLDGVFDADIFGFPQTTRSGLMALALLKAHGCSVVLCTARGAIDVRQYCEVYGLPGGVAESGCVFVDAVRGREVSLLEPQAEEQLARCRRLVQSLPRVVVDPNYVAAVRACRMDRHQTEGLRHAELQAILARPGLDQLSGDTTSADTTIVPRGVGKGAGARWVRRYLELDQEPVAAVGDNDQDVELLREADEAFAPANASVRVRQLAAAGGCTLTRLPVQRGLLEAARRLVHPDGGRCHDCDVRIGRASGAGAVIQELSDATERSRGRRYLSLLDLRGF